ncbi:MAG: DsbA family protein [Candidatus Altiarchaeota archaeon]
MADDEVKKDLDVTPAPEEVKESKKKAVRKKSSKKAARKKPSKTAYVSDDIKEDKEKSVSLDVLLVVFLFLSLLLNFYFFYENSSLKSEVEKMKVGGSAGVTTTLKAKPTATTKPGNMGDKVTVEFYVMSQCPFGTQVEDAIKPVLDQIGGSVDFHLDFIATDNGDGTFTSLHGEKEVRGNIVQLCAADISPDKYMDMVVCMNKNAQNIPDNWESCAKENNMDVEGIKSCYNGDQGKNLLSESSKKAANRQARGSPTMYINNKQYSGSRKSTDFLRAICNEFPGNKPDACSNIPEPVKVMAVTMSDSRCETCDSDVTSIKSQLKAIFPGIVFTDYDYGTQDGKKFYGDVGLKYLPAILFDESVTKGEGYSSVQRYLTQKGKYYDLAIGSDFDPTKEICDNEKDDTGNGKIDCDDPDCVEDMKCREEMEKKLDVYVMSMCPYGMRALDAMKDVLENFGENIDFNIHYIASYSEQTDTFNSLHGQPEVDENIRELCAMKYYPDNYRYMDYVWCRDKNMNAEWSNCVTEAGMDLAKMKSCAEGDEGKGLLKEDLKIAQSLGVGASPTWLANNKYTFSGLDSETIKSNYCAYNEGLEGCENTLAGQPAQPVAAGACG